jgi:hypothetical protein
MAAVVVMLTAPGRAFAQGDEIQVYDGGLAPKGVFNLTWHNNFTPKGNTTPAFPGAVVADKSWNGVPEWAYGVNSWFEAGLYMPLYSRDKNMGFGADGFKLRTLFAVPNADDRKFFYGSNFEYSYNAKRWDEKRFTSEIRPIIGWHFEKLDFIVNPILDTAYDGFKNLVFAPSMRLAYNVDDKTAVSVEEYAEYGPLSGFLPASQQSHQIYGVLNRTINKVEIETGIGFGLTDASDRCTVKFMFGFDFNQPKKTSKKKP